ncbi:MAG: hypothetical protein ACO1OF_19880 [Adhaeribacter sp.]
MNYKTSWYIMEESPATPYFISIFKNFKVGLIRCVDLGMSVSELQQSEGKPFYEGFTDMAFSTYDFFLDPDKDTRYEITFFHNNGLIQRIQFTFEYDRHLTNNISFEEFESILQDINQLLIIRYGQPLTDKTQKVSQNGMEQIRTWIVQQKNMQITKVIWFNPNQVEEKMVQLKFSYRLIE